MLRLYVYSRSFSLIRIPPAFHVPMDHGFLAFNSARPARVPSAPLNLHIEVDLRSAFDDVAHSKWLPIAVLDRSLALATGHAYVALS